MSPRLQEAIACIYSVLFVIAAAIPILREDWEWFYVLNHSQDLIHVVKSYFYIFLMILFFLNNGTVLISGAEK